MTQHYDPLNLFKAFMHAGLEMMKQPDKLVESQLELAKQNLNMIRDFSQELLGKGQMKTTKDSRFKDEAWELNPVYKFLKESYLLNSSWLQEQTHKVKHLDREEKRKVQFYTKFLTDAVSPTNFAATNPTVLKELAESKGESLLKGLKNFLHDLEHSQGGLSIATADKDAFVIGENIAATPGVVVYQNRLMQLIHYKPKQAKVYKIPVIVMPAWINKYYILDLQPSNSFVNWMLEQGLDVYMISWVNPDESHKDIEFEDYMQQGPLAALEFVQSGGREQVNFIGYCLGGTLLAITLSYLKQKLKKKFPINSATFLTTLVDFSEPGDLGVFIDEQQLQTLEKRMSERGYLDGAEMAQTFSLIRANDMIWSFYVNNYLLGKEPMAFDILYWNSDSTRLPAKMHSYYLRQMYQKNNLVKGRLRVAGEEINLSKLDLPVYMLATKEDHITPWASVFKACKIFKGPVHFTLSASGHVAGVVNHPSKNKYCYWEGDKNYDNPENWFAKAKEHPGSWWNDWIKWVSSKSGPKVASRKLEKAIEQAPGSYVKTRLRD